MFIGPETGAAVNPARAFGPMFGDLFYGVHVDWLAFLVSYLIGPIIGGVAAAHHIVTQFLETVFDFVLFVNVADVELVAMIF